MNRIDALTFAFNDTARPAHERDAALAALRSLITDGSDPAERQQAQAAVNTLDHPETAADTRLEYELLSEFHCATLGDVQCVNLHEFCAARRFSAGTDKLFFKWLSVAPAAQQKLRQMRRHLEHFLLASYDALLARYKSALDAGGDMSAANREALAFYRSWADSVVVPEELRSHFRQLIADLSTKCEGHHDDQSR